MALQYGALLRSAQVDCIQTRAGAASILSLYSGSPPADCATAPSGTLLVDMALPNPAMAAASAGQAAKSGSWSGTGLAGAGAGTNAGYWRLWNTSSKTECIAQGTITATGGGGDITLDNVSVAQNQTVTINTFTVTAANS